MSVSKNMDAYDIYLLELFELVEGEHGDTIIRVPGGWIFNNKKLKTSTFVPFSDEFKPEDLEDIRRDDLDEEP